MAGTLIVLGSAQDGGIPQLGGGSGIGKPRLVSSVAVVMEDGTTLLVDVTPDVTAQIGSLAGRRAYQARAARNAVDHIALTHAHMGHYAGLVQFGREAHNATAVPTWVTASMAAFLRANQPWAALIEGGHLDINADHGFERIEIAPGLVLRLVPVPHRDEFTDTVGISINDEALFIPDIDSWEQWPSAEEEIAGHRICLLDGSFSTREEVSGRDITDIPHPLVSDTLARFGHLTDERRLILTHINHTNPIADPDSAAAAVVRASGFEVAEDNMSIPLRV